MQNHLNEAYALVGVGGAARRSARHEVADVWESVREADRRRVGAGSFSESRVRTPVWVVVGESLGLIPDIDAR